MIKPLKHKKFVTIGNGTGQATILKQLQNYIDDISVIVGVTDNGGHSGVLRKVMNIPAPGDLRNCITAVSEPNELITKLLKYRFAHDKLNGTSLGNLIISALIDIEGDLGKAIQAITKAIGLKVKVYPSTIENTNICAELEDGQIIEGEFEIIKRENKDSKIVRMFHNPTVQAYEPCIKAIEEADVIIIAPGTLRTGIISTLLSNGMKEAFQKTSAKIIFICNIMTNPGQTEGFSTQDHIDELIKYMGKKPDYALIHSGFIPGFIQEIYIKERSFPVKHINIDHNDINIIMEDLLEEIDEKELSKYQRIGGIEIKKTPHLIRHNSTKVANIIIELSQN